MPTNHDETLHERYAREHQSQLAIYARMTPEQISDMATELHNALARLAALESQQAASVGGEREAFEAWAASVGYHTERDMFQREKYQSTLTWELWRVWQARAALSPAGGGVVTDAARDVLAERQRQVSAEDFDASHDDMATGGQLADAAACYALWAGGINPANWSQFWPWDREWLKHAEPRRMLIKAGALILAEIERLDRASAKPQANSQEAEE